MFFYLLVLFLLEHLHFDNFFIALLKLLLEQLALLICPHKAVLDIDPPCLLVSQLPL
jgi:hypothetical protein